MQPRDAWFFVGLLVFIFVIWIATGGPTRPLAISTPSLGLSTGAATGTAQAGGGAVSFLPHAPFTIGTSNVVLPGSSVGGGAVSGGSQAPVPTFIGGTTFGTPSPYRGIVTMSHSVYGAGSSNPSNEYVIISVSQNAGVPVDLTGWTLESEATGNATVIPQGTQLPTSGVINPVQDIVLLPGQRAIADSGQSPIGASFLENKCIGYFSNFQTFYPALPQNCPTPSSELETFYGTGYIRDSACIEYVKTLNRCQVALTPPLGASSACQSFLVNYLNYNGCVTAHRDDADFEGNTWRIYLGRTASMWRKQYELVKLLDKSGKTVDAFTY
ncbi:MAG TPA: hypothetical protein VMV50_02300 [Candidatus Paceibacterota bacterium]|nr:hypothetical protein [Candidatus Paceibacterota bacterium]